MKNKKSIIKFALIGAFILGTLGLSTDTYADTKMLTENEARSIALKDMPNGKITKLKLDHEHGKQTYEIKVVEGNVEKKYEIDAYSGQILKMDADYEHKNITPEKNTQISFEQAKEIALKNSAKNGTIKSIELDYEYGRAVYEIEVGEGFMEREFIIDAVTGEILKSKKDF